MDAATHLQASYYQGTDTPSLIDQTIGNYLDDIATRFANREALVVRHQGIRWSYGEYLCEIERLAMGLLAVGIRAGDRVGIWAPNCAEWCLTQFATAKIGAILVCINPAYRVFELEYALRRSGCRAVIAAERFKSSRYLDMLAQLAPAMATGMSSGMTAHSGTPAKVRLVRCGCWPATKRSETTGKTTRSFMPLSPLGGGQSDIWVRVPT